MAKARIARTRQTAVSRVTPRPAAPKDRPIDTSAGHIAEELRGLAHVLRITEPEELTDSAIFFLSNAIDGLAARLDR